MRQVSIGQEIREIAVRHVSREKDEDWCDMLERQVRQIFRETSEQ